jgi:hypothetical protein
VCIISPEGCEFRWNDWNLQHIGGYRVGREAAEYIIRRARRPYPRYEGDGKFVVGGQSFDGVYMQVIYIMSPADIIYVIHARALTDVEKRRHRRGRNT